MCSQLDYANKHSYYIIIFADKNGVIVFQCKIHIPMSITMWRFHTTRVCLPLCTDHHPRVRHNVLVCCFQASREYPHPNTVHYQGTYSITTIVYYTTVMLNWRISLDLLWLREMRLMFTTCWSICVTVSTTHMWGMEECVTVMCHVKLSRVVEEHS